MSRSAVLVRPRPGPSCIRSPMTAAAHGWGCRPMPASSSRAVPAASLAAIRTARTQPSECPTRKTPAPRGREASSRPPHGRPARPAGGGGHLVAVATPSSRIRAGQRDDGEPTAAPPAAAKGGPGASKYPDVTAPPCSATTTARGSGTSAPAPTSPPRPRSTTASPASHPTRAERQLPSRVRPQEQHPAGSEATGAHHGDPRPGTCRARPRRAAGRPPRAPGPCRGWRPWRELAAVRVQRQRAVPGDVLPPSRKSFASPMPQNPRASIQEQAVEREAVVELGHVDVAGPQRRARPQVSSLAEDLWLVRQRALVPLEPLDDLGAHRLHQHRGPARSRAAPTAETITATAPSQGTSQSYRPNGVVISRASRYSRM